MGFAFKKEDMNKKHLIDLIWFVAMEVALNDLSLEAAESILDDWLTDQDEITKIDEWERLY